MRRLDAGTGGVLDTESPTRFSGGAYPQWPVSGPVQIEVIHLGPVNAL